MLTLGGGVGAAVTGLVVKSVLATVANDARSIIGDCTPMPTWPPTDSDIDRLPHIEWPPVDIPLDLPTDCWPKPFDPPVDRVEPLPPWDLPFDGPFEPLEPRVSL